MCEFTGTRNVSEAMPGPCTGTRGYISNAEIEEYVAMAAMAKRDPNSKLGKRALPVEIDYDATTRSNIAIIDGTWIAYMDATEKADRSKTYKRLNMGGTSDWAVDLESFTNLERRTSAGILQNKFSKKGVVIPEDGQPEDDGTVHWYDIECSDRAVSNATEIRKTRWEAAKAGEAWSDAIAAYNTSTSDTGSFSSWIIGHFFRGTEGVHCGGTRVASHCNNWKEECLDRVNTPHNLTTTPAQRTGPAGNFIAYSFVELEQAFVNYYQSIKDARSEVSDLIPVFEGYFMQERDNTFGKQLGWNILAVVSYLSLYVEHCVMMDSLLTDAHLVL